MCRKKDEETKQILDLRATSGGAKTLCLESRETVTDNYDSYRVKEVHLWSQFLGPSDGPKYIYELFAVTVIVVIICPVGL